MKNLMKKYGLLLAGGITGGIGGFLYWKFVGCLGGSCAITSDPLNSTLYFAAMGTILGSMFRKDTTPAKPLDGAGTNDEKSSR